MEQLIRRRVRQDERRAERQHSRLPIARRMNGLDGFGDYRTSGTEV